MDERSLVGLVDIGGTKIRVGIGQQARLLKAVSVATDSSAGADAVIWRVAQTLSRLVEELGFQESDISRIGLAVPGPLDQSQGIVRYAGILQWIDYPVAQRLSTALQGIPVRIDDDANLAALGEAHYGAGAAYGDQWFITVSTGIGGSMIIEGQVYQGAQGFAGEIGHTSVMSDGPPCICGNRGCLEAVASGTAIASLGNELGLRGESRILAELVDQGVIVTAEHVAKAATRGDPSCIDVFREAADYLGLALANVINLCSPEILILGGGVIYGYPPMLEQVVEQVESRILAVYQNKLPIKMGILGQDAGLWGAYHMISRSAVDDLTT